MLDKESFWNFKIIEWEKKRYKSLPFVKTSIHHRMMYALEAISKIQSPKMKIIEFGCGSGILASHLPADIFYHGHDFAFNAIEAAKKRLSGRENFHFYQSDLTQSQVTWEADLIIGLGFVDWITTQELEDLLMKCQCNHIIFSYSSNEKHWMTPFYDLYSKMSFSKSYKPKFYDTNFLINLFKQRGFNTFHEVMGKGMLFGRILVASK